MKHKITLLLLCFIIPLSSCTVTLNKGYVIPESCGDRWVCTDKCDPNYPFLCEPWSTENE